MVMLRLLAGVMVHTVDGDAVSVTGRPELAVAPDASGVVLNGVEAGCANVIVWAAPTTFNVNACVVKPLVLVAVIVTGKVPMAGAFPERTPAEESVTVAGRPAPALYVGAGEPLATTLNVPATPAVKVVEAALEKLVGAEASVRVMLACEVGGVVTVLPQVPSVSTSKVEPVVLIM